MRKIMIFALGLILIAGGIAAQNGKMSWNFDKDKVGEIAKGFTNEVGKWEVAPDSTAPSKPNVLAQLAKSSGRRSMSPLLTEATIKTWILQ